MMLKFPTLSRRRGFTITELVIASVINMIVCVGAFSVFVAAAKMQRDIFNHNTVDAEARMVENWLVTDMRSAMTVEDSYSHGGTTYTADGETLILRLPAVDIEGVPTNLQDDPAASDSDFIVYYHNDEGEMRRMLVRHANSWRDGSNDPVDDRAVAESFDTGITHKTAFSVAPGILGPVVVHYEFRSSREKYNSEKNYIVASAGSVYLRNRPMDAP